MKISFIIPTYNEEKRILHTLEPLQQLRNSECEIIVTDNGSTDATCDIIQNFVDQVVQFPQQSNRSTIGECRNRGAAVATGDILWFIDADVLIPKLQEVYALIQQKFNSNERLVAIALPSRLYPEEERCIDKIIFGIINVNMYAANHIFRFGGAGGDCQIIRASAFRKIKGYDPQFYTSEDWDIFHRLTKIGRTIVLMNYPMVMSGRRIHRDGWSPLLWAWFSNWITQCILRKPNTKAWEARR